MKLGKEPLFAETNSAPPALIDEDTVVLSVLLIVLQSRTIMACPEAVGATTSTTTRTSNQ